MSVHRIIHQQIINAQLAEIWDFFIAPDNLERLTPKDMRFKTTFPETPGPIYPGMVITYTVAPLFGIPLFWMTEITHVDPLCRFVDEQRAGPYRLWHHQHLFRQLADGQVEMTDVIHYALPLGWLGDIVNRLLVRQRLRHIFDYRRQVVDRIFNTGKAG
jgi:ligand-binding SRPBCC domain-containing protein